MIPFFDQYGIPLFRVLTDRGSEFCGNPERHEYELYLAVENIDHSRTKTKGPQTTKPQSTNCQITSQLLEITTAMATA